jgi:hypothetical protein
LFLGLFGVTAVGITAGSLIVLYGMHVVDGKASSIIGFAKNTIEGLPDLVDSLPVVVADALSDRRAPDYASNIKIDVNLIEGKRAGTVRPVLTISNNGDQVVSMLAVRVAALSAANVPIRDWTQVVATPVAIDDDWRGPLFPHATRHVAFSRWGDTWSHEDLGSMTATTEISELRVWEPSDRPVRTASVID